MQENRAFLRTDLPFARVLRRLQKENAKHTWVTKSKSTWASSNEWPSSSHTMCQPVLTWLLEELLQSHTTPWLTLFPHSAPSISRLQRKSNPKMPCSMSIRIYKEMKITNPLSIPLVLQTAKIQMKIPRERWLLKGFSKALTSLRPKMKGLDLWGSEIRKKQRTSKHKDTLSSWVPLTLFCKSNKSIK